MGGSIPHDIQLLYVKMLQNKTAIAEPATPIKIKYDLETSDFQEPIQIVLQSMVMHDLAEKQIEVVPISDSLGREIRLIESYQVSLSALENLI